MENKEQVILVTTSKYKLVYSLYEKHVLTDEKNQPFVENLNYKINLNFPH